MTRFLVIMSTLFSLQTVYAAELCQPTSCNPHNGCTAGCTIQKAVGFSDCNLNPLPLAETLAIEEADTYMFQRCYKGHFVRAPFDISIQQDLSACIVKATARFSCYK